MVHLHNGILRSREKEGAYTVCNSMDGTGEHYAKGNKPCGEEQMPYDLTFNWNIIKRRKKQKKCLFFINVQIQLSPVSNHHLPLPHLRPPPTLITTPLWLVHGSLYMFFDNPFFFVTSFFYSLHHRGISV